MARQGLANPGLLHLIRGFVNPLRAEVNIITVQGLLPLCTSILSGAELRITNCELRIANQGCLIDWQSNLGQIFTGNSIIVVVQFVRIISRTPLRQKKRLCICLC